MYFDIGYWWRVVRHVWGLKGWSGRNPMLLRLLVWIPLRTVLHGSCFLLDYLFFPALWSQRVERPVFIVGHARSGTTLMHRLMSADGDRFSYFLYWEMFWLDAHLLGSFLQRQLQRWDDKTFGPYRHMHNMSLWNAEEDCFAMAGAFVSQQWSLDIPMMDVVDFFHVDQMAGRRRRWMHHYRELVKRQLLLNGGDKTHLSKNPVMSGWVDALIETFPEARIVVMMRNPTECIPSCLKLVQSSWRRGGWTQGDYSESLNILTEISFEHFEYPRKILAQHRETPQIEVDYRQLTSAPRETVHAVYRALGIDLTEDFDTWLQAQAEREKKHHSKFEYSLGEFHLRGEDIQSRLAGFYQQYQWEISPAETEASHGG